MKIKVTYDYFISIILCFILETLLLYFLLKYFNIVHFSSSNASNTLYFIAELLFILYLCYQAYKENKNTIISLKQQTIAKILIISICLLITLFLVTYALQNSIIVVGIFLIIILIMYLLSVISISYIYSKIQKIT